MGKHKKPALGNGLYDILKFVALILLPAAGAAYYSLAAVWGLPNADQVVGTIVIVDTFLGALLGISTAQYNNSDDRFDGEMIVNEGEEKVDVNLDLSKTPEALVVKDEVRFKVKRPAQ